jgi:hypothetical protein
MLRMNLSTRPFYNERGVYLALVVVGLLVAGLTVFNLVQVITLSATQTELRARADRDEAQARELNERAAVVRRGIDASQLQAVVAAAGEANALIDRRTFSWTELFNRIESTLPGDVMLVSLKPEIQNGEPHVSMVVIGRGVEHIDAFMERLEATGAFAGVLSRQEEMAEGGGYRAVLRGRYLETPIAVAPAATPGPAGEESPADDPMADVPHPSAADGVGDPAQAMPEAE